MKSVRSIPPTSGQRVMNSVTRFITQKLQLKVNETKSAVARPQERKLLGFSFTNGPAVKRAIAPKALDRFKDRIREITRRAKGVSIVSVRQNHIDSYRLLAAHAVGVSSGSLWMDKLASPGRTAARY
jgi:hypothetical protein